MTLSQDLRRKFLHYFKEKGHAVIASSPVVPHDDPTLLFTNAGMNQFKDVFLGKTIRDFTRATTSQKCIRVGGKHNDLDNVGHTSRHLTFFEMLGNFSFGDYFKKEAILFAWEVATRIFEFPEEKIWPTIFETDEEAFELWKQLVPEKRITRLGEKDNFWSMGDTGPCGPCSELYLDRGPQYGDAPSPKEDASGERYLEFWNLVFMQFNRSQSGQLSPLPKQSIDTGAGLERVVSLKLGVNSVFATDLLRSLIAEVENISGRKYNPDDKEFAPAYHVIADHIRSLSFAIADGAQPSNLDRGYVLRKLLRRAVRYGRMLHLTEPFLSRLLPRLIQEMGEDYPELKTAENRICEILTVEEESFLRTLKRGGNILNNVIEEAKNSSPRHISGEDAFKLKDTYGFPLEEILLIAKDTGLEVNLDQYQLLEESAREKSRSAQATHHHVAEESLFKEFFEKMGPSHFTGYTAANGTGKILGIVHNGKFVDQLTLSDEAWVILDETPFYAEKGGQIYDTGSLTAEHLSFKVTDCRVPFPGIIVHIGKLERGELLSGQIVHASIDLPRRQHIMAHHTATHLLHWALQEVLGTHIRQAGSLVEPDRLRFDFNHHKPVTHEELRAIEDLVNEKIRTNQPVTTYELSYEEVQKKGEIKQFFGDKYGAIVRVVDIDFSKELCGGTHVHHLGTIGLFRILKEGSISAGVRRIEAVTGKPATEFMYAQENLLHHCATLLKTAPLKTPEALIHLIDQVKDLSQELKTYRRTILHQKAQELIHQVETIGALSFLIAEVALPAEELGILADEILQKKKPLVLVLGARFEDKAQLLVRVSPEFTSKGISAATLIKELAPSIGGSGGGKMDSAQAGGKNPHGLEDALTRAKESVQQAIAKA
ncbi:MAG: alanine--tRNA ligase [Simkania sp.]|nr:alanine--tRNA ligase [Simkania sp.]